jgi:hypothetical protein
MPHEFENTQADKPQSVEKWGPLLLLHRMGLERLAPPAEAEVRGYLAAAPPVERFLPALAGDGSWNTPQILAAVRLWEGTPGARDAWVRYCRYQSGRQEPPPELAKLRYLGGSEPLSINYVDWRIGALLAVRAWALAAQDATLAEEVGRLLTVYAAVGTLIAVDAPDANVAVNARGKKLDDAVWVGSPGERSALHHLAGNRRIHFTLLGLGREVRQVRAPEWDVRIARAVPDPGVSSDIRARLAACLAAPTSPAALQPVLALLAGVKISSEIRILWWPELRLILNPERNNRNSTAILAEGFDRRTREVWVLHPFEEGRAWNDKAGGKAWIEGAEVIARTDDGREERHALPASPPLLEVVLDPTGVRIAGRDGEPAEPPGSEQPPGEEAAELRAIAARLLAASKALAEDAVRLAALARGPVGPAGAG